MISAEVGELYAFPQYTQNFLADTWYNVEQGFATGITLNSLYAIKDSLNYAYRSNAKWYMSTSTYTALQQTLVDGEHRGIFGRGDVSQNMPETLLGYPIEIDDYMPAVAANACPIVFGDMRQGYAILERPGIGVLRDMYSNKPYIGLYSIKSTQSIVRSCYQRIIKIFP